MSFVFRCVFKSSLLIEITLVIDAGSSGAEAYSS